MNSADKRQIALISEQLHTAAHGFSADGDDWQKAWIALRRAQMTCAHMLGHMHTVSGLQEELDMHERLKRATVIDSTEVLRRFHARRYAGKSGSSNGEGPAEDISTNDSGS